MKLKQEILSFNLKKSLFEFFSVFFAVTFAFLLSQWNEDRKDDLTESKILIEIYNGLKRDSLDLALDEKYFKINIDAIKYFNDITNDVEVNNDSLPLYYFYLTRDLLTIQNTSGYETLKSKGLEIIKNDSLRKSIIDLYEVTYKLHRKFSEEYDENKYMKNYFDKINDVIAPHFIFDSKNNLTWLNQPINLKNHDKNIVKSYLWKLTVNRNDRLGATRGNQKKIGRVRRLIKENLK
jgi:hypothetical protein